ncbi:MAG TPA: class I SAM-dependent methyltransferase [Amycolatopsis sp.]|uniref:class I SAM-dependent methyltransferase n=1 Tax=Amycolatopsis sp. TaxID=37632 RepID=UPI002F41694A
MTGQIHHWDGLHSARDAGASSDGPSTLAEETARSLDTRARVLELGCGAGADAAHFAREGHEVLALDFSAVAIRRASRHYVGLGVEFREVDFSRPLDLPSESFDLVYSRLSLHYFTDDVTRALIGEVARLLVRDGCLVVLCRSVADPLCGRGVKIEDNMFRLDDHVRHFFSVGYMRELIADRFGQAEVTEFDGSAYGYESAFVKAVARRK